MTVRIATATLRYLDHNNTIRSGGCLLNEPIAQSGFMKLQMIELIYMQDLCPGVVLRKFIYIYVLLWIDEYNMFESSIL